MSRILVASPLRGASPLQDSRLGILLVGAGLLGAGGYLLLHGYYSIFSLLVILIAFMIAWQANQVVGIALVLAYLTVLGDARRIINLLGGPQSLDPTLLVGPLFCLYLVLPLLLQLKAVDALTKVVMALMVVMVLEIFNPLQGSMAVGLSGAMFYLVPLFWFWVGRRFATQRMIFVLLFRIMVPLGVLGALVGIYQTYYGPLPWQRAWADSVGTSIGLFFGHGQIRSFGFSTSGLEYSSLLLIATTCIAGAIFVGRYVYAPLLLIILPAEILASGRGSIIRVIFAVALMWALRSRSRRVYLPRFIFAVVIGLGFTYYTASHSDLVNVDYHGNSGLTTSQAATAHLVQGLADPTHSTATIHRDALVIGIVRGFTNPLGFGLGSTTLGALKFGGEMLSTEFDISDVFTATGFIGGFLYLAVVSITVMRLLSYRQLRPDILSITLVGFLVGNIGGWTAAGQYSMAFLVFFCIGFISREASPRRQIEAAHMRSRRVVTSGQELSS